MSYRQVLSSKVHPPQWLTIFEGFKTLFLQDT